jgi:UDPglucose 6-dehydrogenase
MVNKIEMKIKNICCIGAGYVGGPTMAVIALNCPEIKINVVDLDKNKINLWNSDNLDNLPVYEPGLDKIISKTRNKNLFFSSELKNSIQAADIIFISVNSPTKTDGDGAGFACDLTNVFSCAKDIARYSKSDKIIVEKSTVPVKTVDKLKQIFNSENSSVNFEILSNPEFLAEGTAVNDLINPDRVLIGGDISKSGKIATQHLVDIYSKWIPKSKILTTNVWSSELSKLASNAMLAQRVSSINSLSALCSKTGAEIDELSKAIGMDNRIGSSFLKVSPGFGGSCFKKDMLNLIYLCNYYDLPEVAEYWSQVLKINDFQTNRVVDLVDDYLINNSIKKHISILGWAYKKNTNDSRGSTSIPIASRLLQMGYKLNIYDPQVESKTIINDLEESLAKSVPKTNIFISNEIESILNLNRPYLILTEWDEFKNIKFKKDQDIVFDYRNFLNKEKTTLRF